MLELKEKQERKEILEEDVEVLKAKVHPIRLQIVNELMYHKTCNTQLIEILNLPQSTVSQHLSKLRGTVLRAERKGLEMHYYIENSKAR
ncbi:ArsR/SmtB family transcription factor [Bacillus cereus group sp. MYBK5-2]|uniref:ArsR/SmtB family transcription factor n=1 Tax=Bacillus cereus group sp. MYBK5-2 TaxID=3450622 RepID=UPI003F7B016D